MQRFAFFEDQSASQFTPIALLRPVFELLCGHGSVRQRICDTFPDSEWGAVLRPMLSECYREEHPQAAINDDQWLREEPLLLINGRCRLIPDELAQLQPGSAGWVDDTPAAIAIAPADKLTTAEILEGTRLEQIAREKRPVHLSGTVFRYPWDLIAANPEWLRQDFSDRIARVAAASSPLDSRVAVVGPQSQLFVDASARLDPFVVIDVSGGPVWIDRNVRVQAFTRIEGPAYLGPETQLFRANVREGCSFGPVCRLGGEIEESIVHGYANKYHDGFLGHSYVAPWVNLGALTTNSDLKNDYSNVSVPLAGESIRSGSTKVGCFIGDHTKTALCSLFNTGSSIGVMSLILPGGELLPKHIPSFSRVWHGKIEPPPDGTATAIQTARLAMARRGKELTPAMERLLQSVFEATQPARELAMARHSGR